MTSNNIVNWIGDGSEGNISIDSRSLITFSSASKGTPFNIRLDTTSDAQYYEAQITSLPSGSSIAVGLVTESGFLPGWKTRGCFYNGNITNGSAGLIIGFGKYIKEGDTVGVLYQQAPADRKCNIIFYINGRCLGTGFSLDEEEHKRYYPCLHLSGNATVKYSSLPPPTVFEREQQQACEQDDVYSGDWQIEQAFEGPELGQVQLPEGSSFKVSLEKISSSEFSVQYRLSIKIGNSISTSFAIVGKMEEAFDKIELANGCMSTKMMPRPELRQLENLVLTALEHDGGIQKIIVTEDEKLIMTGPTAEIICSRYNETFEPVTSL